MLSNYHLLYITSHHECTERVLDGVYSLDYIPPNVSKFPAFWISNSAKSYEKGVHWFSCFFPSNDSPVEFFCSLGKKPSDYSTELVKVLKNNGNGVIKCNSHKS